MSQPKTTARYYTPTIEDLIFGLEFELYSNNDNSWDKRCILYGHTFGDARNEIVINKNNIRIKHLDEDDILDLGWQSTIGIISTFVLGEY